MKKSTKGDKNNVYRFQEHNLIIEGEKEDLIYLAELLRYAEGTVGDLRYQIEYAFDIDGVLGDNDPERSPAERGRTWKKSFRS